MSVSVSFSPHPRLCKKWVITKMPVSLEPVGVPGTIESETTPVEEPQISENVETPPVEEPPVAIESENKPILPELKKRGRPRKEVPKEPKTPKAAPKKAVRMKPPSPVNESSSEEETPLTRDDMETLLLDYLVKRKQSQHQAGRTMWSQLAGLS